MLLAFFKLDLPAIQSSRARDNDTQVSKRKTDVGVVVLLLEELRLRQELKTQLRIRPALNAQKYRLERVVAGIFELCEVVWIDADRWTWCRWQRRVGLRPAATLLLQHLSAVRVRVRIGRALFGYSFLASHGVFNDETWRCCVTSTDGRHNLVRYSMSNTIRYKSTAQG